MYFNRDDIHHSKNPQIRTIYSIFVSQHTSVHCILCMFLPQLKAHKQRRSSVLQQNSENKTALHKVSKVDASREVD